MHEPGFLEKKDLQLSYTEYVRCATGGQVLWLCQGASQSLFFFFFFFRELQLGGLCPGGVTGFYLRCQGELLGLWDPQNRDLRRKPPPESKFLVG